MLLSFILLAGIETGLKHYLEYKISISKGDYQKARIAIDEALKYSPDSAFLHYTKARLLIDVLDIDEAYKSIKRAIEISTSNPDYWLLYGEVARIKNEYVNAAYAFEMAGKLKDLVDIKLKEIEMLIEFDTATAIKKIDELNLKSIDALNGIRLLQLTKKLDIKTANKIGRELLNNFDSAGIWIEYLDTIEDPIKLLNALLEFDKKFEGAYNYVASKLYFAGFYDEALVVLADKYDRDALIIKGYIKYLKNEFSEAADLLKEALKIEYSDDVAIKLASCLVETGSKKEAFRILKKLLNSRDEVILKITGFMFMEIENYRYAIKALSKIKNPTITERFNLAVAWDRINKFDVSEKILLEILASTPHALSLNYIAYSWALKNKNLEKALEFSIRSLSIEPDNPAFLDTYGWIVYKMGNIDEALKYILRASELENDSEIYEHLGIIYMEKNMFEEARNAFENSLRIKFNKSVYGLWKRVYKLKPLNEKNFLSFYRVNVSKIKGFIASGRNVAFEYDSGEITPETPFKEEILKIIEFMKNPSGTFKFEKHTRFLKEIRDMDISVEIHEYTYFEGYWLPKKLKISYRGKTIDVDIKYTRVD